MVEVEVEDGLLVWDGQVLELFRSDGRTGAFRVHARVVGRWELEPRRGCSLLKVFTGRKHYESALVPDASTPAVEAIMHQLDASRA